MSMKKKALMAASYVMVAALAVGGTVAYLTDTDSDTNTMTLGNVSIEQHEYERVVNNDGSFATDTVDNQTSYVLDEFTQDKPLLPIVGDPNEPSSSAAYAGYDSTIVRMTQVDSYGNMQVFAGENAQDKFVTVENTGKTDAYVRTLVAIECGDEELVSKIGISTRATSKPDKDLTTPWISNYIGNIAIGENRYMVYEFTYRGASDVNRHVGGILPADDTTYPNLSQVYLKHNTTNEDIEKIDGNDDGIMDILVVSQAVQAQGFDNAQEALDTAFGKVAEADEATLIEWFAIEETEETTEASEDAGE